MPKTQKMVLDASLHNTQHNKVCIKGKVEQPRKRSSAFLRLLDVAAIDKEYIFDIYLKTGFGIK